MFQLESQRLQFMIWGVIFFLLILTAIGYAGDADDTYWHVKVGEWILTYSQIPKTGIFSYTNADTVWVSHEWLSAVFLYKVFQYSGWSGLFFLTLLCLFVTMLTLLWFLLKRLTVVQSLIFILFAYLLIMQHVLPRPHIFAIPIMTYWTACLINSAESKTKPPFYILPLMILWVNLHGSFIVGIAFSIFFAVEAIFYASLETRKTLTHNWGIFILAVIICATITPHGIDGLLMPFQTSNLTYTLSIIIEWASPNFHKYQPLELWLLSFLALVLIQGIKLPIFRLVFLLGLIHLSLKHVRHACDLLSVLSPLILATPLAKQWNSTLELSFNDFCPKNYKGLFLIGGYFLGMFLYLDNIKIIERKENIRIKEVLYTLRPEQQKLGNVLNDYNIADFLIHLDYPVFIDSRGELYKDDFNKYYFDAIQLKESGDTLKSMMSKYKVEWTIFFTYQAINAYLMTQPEWHKIYSDKLITIFIHDSVNLSNQTLTKLKLLEKSKLEN